MTHIDWMLLLLAIAVLLEAAAHLVATTQVRLVLGAAAVLAVVVGVLALVNW